jgi:hypothetical protein
VAQTLWHVPDLGNDHFLVVDNRELFGRNRAITRHLTDNSFRGDWNFMDCAPKTPPIVDGSRALSLIT